MNKLLRFLVLAGVVSISLLYYYCGNFDEGCVSKRYKQLLYEWIDNTINATSNRFLKKKQNRKLLHNVESTNQPIGTTLNQKNIQPYSGIMTFRSISCKPIHPGVLLYNRIFKTGSSSMEEYMSALSTKLNFFVKKSTTEDWYKTGESFPYPDVIEKYGMYNSTNVAFVAHFFFRDNLQINKSYTYMNMIREPVHRLLSHYKYQRNEFLRPRYRVNELKNSLEWYETLEECIRKQHRGCEDNVMTRFFCGVHSFCKTGSKKAYRRAVKNVRRYYSVIGVLEEKDTFLKILSKRMPEYFKTTRNFRFPFIKVNNETKEISRKSLKLIEKRNQADRKLYRYIKKRFVKQKRICGL